MVASRHNTLGETLLAWIETRHYELGEAGTRALWQGKHAKLGVRIGIGEVGMRVSGRLGYGRACARKGSRGASACGGRGMPTIDGMLGGRKGASDRGRVGMLGEEGYV
ncbi:unnamed protein product [Dovyalis caffra]|uniref:Uncharacterized protein n=1 Tax=Dovyalis caffra TaxID=77055 RepID=A0AAV1R523_9ROSI|nr:unnamed protein product [Dovyalis caffra]